MKGIEIVIKALEKISNGTEDITYPFRSAPREILIKVARDALAEYHIDKSIKAVTSTECVQNFKCPGKTRPHICAECDLS